MNFTPVSPLLVRARLVSLACLVVVAAIILGIAALWLPKTLIAIAGVVLVIAAIWSAIVIVRQVPRIGYQRRDDDLLIRRGIMFQRITVVPYGRMQFIEVEAGPIDRMFGLANLELHTASAHSDANIPGLPRGDADELREVLLRDGSADLVGL